MLPGAAVLLVLALGRDTAAAAEAPPPPPFLALGGGSLFTSVFSSLQNAKCHSERSSNARVRSREIPAAPKGAFTTAFLGAGWQVLVHLCLFKPARSTHAR